MRAIPTRWWLCALGSALLQILPFPIAGPVPMWRREFCWICLVPLLYAILRGVDRTGKTFSWKQAWWVGYACGFAWYAGNCYWIYQTMYLYGGIPKPLSAGILVLFSMYLGLYHGLFAVLLWMMKRWSSAGVALAVSPLLWVAVELARTQITGFPWDLLGYTRVDDPARGFLVPLTFVAPWTGAMGISFIIAAVNAYFLIASEKLNRKLRWRWIFALLLGSCLIPTHKPRDEQKDGSAVLLQDNLGVGKEGEENHESKNQLLASLTELSLHPSQGSVEHPQVILWPEAPTSFVDTDPMLRSSLQSLAQQSHAALVINDVSFASQNTNGRYNLYNSASFFMPDGSDAGRYDKMHLVPFGEYTPYKPLFFFVGHLLDDLPFVPGKSRSVFVDGDHRFGVFICYESIFGDEVREFAKQGAQVLVNISDDGWYGDTSAPWEHLDMARMRAIENHRWLLRSTNTGLTGVIDPQGRITAQLPRHVRGSLAATYAYEHDTTFYTRHGDWFGWLCAVLSGVAIAGAYAKSRTVKAVH